MHEYHFNIACGILEPLRGKNMHYHGTSHPRSSVHVHSGAGGIDAGPKKTPGITELFLPTHP